MSIEAGSQSRATESTVIQKAQAGIGRWAMGASLLHAPEQVLTFIAPEVFEGAITDNDKAYGIAVAGGALIVAGLSDAISAVTESLDMPLTSIRGANNALIFRQAINEQFDVFYASLVKPTEENRAVLAHSLRYVKPKPFEGSSGNKFIHSKKSPSLLSLINPLPIPGWLARTSMLERPVGDFPIPIS